MSARQPRFDIAPIADRVAARGGLAAVLEASGYGRAQAQRLRRVYAKACAATRVGAATFDLLSVGLLGLHPVELLGREWTARPAA